ncbi:hypothetical protein FKW77_009657 [Venturia effusa]|uniref:J domain-containing protein n=1 Tax=Venturia effusa TaxID=50376 RepID=A0A517L493_9PEZI|nr:hypothetical protein FKW77_009657 [Venturia effusa]
MSMSPDRAYNALGLDENTPRKAIRKAYFRLALKHHPDKAKDEKAKQQANEQFRDIQSAYELLTQIGDRGNQPAIDSPKRNQPQPSRAWTEYTTRAAKKPDYSAYVDLDEEEETDDVRYGEGLEDKDESDSDDPDCRVQSEGDESDDNEEAVWPTKEMRTTGYDKHYDAKYTISGDAAKRTVIGDGVNDVAYTAEKEAWDDYRTTAEDRALNKPPSAKSSAEHGEALSSRIMPCGLPRVIGMTGEGEPIHEGEDINKIKIKGNHLTAAQYNRFMRPQIAGRTIAKAVAYRKAVTEIKVIACQECFPGMGQWTVDGDDPFCGNCRGKLERIIVSEEVEDGVSEGDVSGMLLDDREEEGNHFRGGDVREVTYENAMAALAGIRIGAATAKGMIEE